MMTKMNPEIADSIKRLEYLCKIVPGLLAQIDEADFCSKPAPGKWSKKEIFGHLIDSAANNHQRFVRTQFEKTPTIPYDQNKWNEFSYYNEIATAQLINFWTIYNLQIAGLIKCIPESYFVRKCNTGGPDNVTLEWLFNDYVKHQEYHLRQIIEY